MINPHEKYEKEQFWELAKDIASLDAGSKYGQNTGTVPFFRRKKEKD